jgi:predicted nucleotidyltransferase
MHIEVVDMCTMQQLEGIKNQIIDLYKNVYGDSVEEIYLYGSYARGDYDNDSDIDFTAVVKGDRKALHQIAQTSV